MLHLRFKTQMPQVHHRSHRSTNDSLQKHRVSAPKTAPVGCINGFCWVLLETIANSCRVRANLLVRSPANRHGGACDDSHDWFLVVRHPVDRFVAVSRASDIENEADLNAFLQGLLNRPDQSGFRPMAEYFDARCVQHILRYESLDSRRRSQLLLVRMGHLHR